MALGFSSVKASSGGDFLPIIKYDSKSGDIIRVDRTQTAEGEWTKNETEIEFGQDKPLNLVMDLAEIEVGYISFFPNVDFVTVKIGEPMPAKPETPAGSDKNPYAEGFRVRVASTNLGVREFSSTAKTVVNPMDKLHTKFLEQRGEHDGKLPVVSITGTTRVEYEGRDGKTSYKAPKWDIIDWVDRANTPFGAAPATSASTPTADDSTTSDNKLF